jgi:hypothetical protein
VPDLGLRRKVKGRSSEDPKEVSIVDREGGPRTIDLVERAKFSKRRQSH